MKTFAAVDYVVFSFVCCFSIGISIFFAWRDKNHANPDTYFLGGRSMKALPVAISFVVTFQSSNLFLGYPAESYAYGMQHCLQCVGVITAYFLASVIVVPVLHPLGLTSIYEYYYLRYGTNSVRFLGAISGTLYYIFYMGVVMFGTAMAIQSVTGIDYSIALVFLATAATLYTSIGGIKGVIWADVFQFIVMLAGIIAVLVRTTKLSGGFGKVLHTSSSRMNVIFDPDPTLRHSFWNLIIGSIPLYFYLTITQASIQRANSVKTARMAKLLYIISGPTYSLVWITVMIQGLTMYAYFATTRCDPLAAGLVDNINKIFPHTVMELFHSSPGLPGLFISALCSASFSTISSGLNSLAAITYANLIKVFFNTNSKCVRTYLPKLIVILFGIGAVVVALLLSKMKGPLGQILDSFMGALVGMEIGMYLTSIFYRRATVKGIFVGALSGLFLVLWMTLGQTFVAKPHTNYLPLGPVDKCHVHMTELRIENVGNSAVPYNITETGYDDSDMTTPTARSPLMIFYSISYMYFTVIGSIVVIAVSVCVSLLTQPAESNVPQNVTLPLSSLLPTFIKGPVCCQQDAKISHEIAGDENCEMEDMLEAK